MSPIRSKKYLHGSRGARCTLRIVDVCTGDVETTVPAHIRDRHTGRGMKASDLSVVDACGACHDRLDGRTLPLLPREQWLAYALRALQETLEARFHLGLLVVSVDIETPARDRPTPPRLPKDQRAKVGKSAPIQSRSTFATGRKLESRNTFQDRKPK